MPKSTNARPGVVRWVRVAAVPAVLGALAIGVWITGGVLTEDSRAAMALTVAWFLAGAVLAVLVARRWRFLALPVLATYAVGVCAIGGFLAYTSNVDKVVDETVVVALPSAVPASEAPASTASARPKASARTVEPKATAAPKIAGAPAAGPIALASGTFTTGAHRTVGTATLIRKADGTRVLTLTDFSTSPGPDVRVLLTRGKASASDGALDLGALKGNKGNQQYTVPNGAPTGAVVIWCRAFTVVFGSARLN